MSSVKGKSKAFTQNKGRILSYVNCGRRALAERDWAGARDNFDKAISFGGKDIDLLDLKVRALTELEEWRQTAYEITKDMINRWPDDHRGYERQARLLARYHKFERAIQFTSQACELVRAQLKTLPSLPSSSASSASSTSSSARSRLERISKGLNQYRANLIIEKHEHDEARAKNSAAEKEKIEQERLKAKRARMNFINRLSADVIITIAEHGLVEQPGFAVKMAGVCKSWRSILLNQGSLWNKLVLGKKKPIERIKWCMERTRGNIKELKIARDFEYAWTEEVATLLEPSLKGITHLTILVANGPLIDRWAGKFDGLKSLKIDIPEGYPLMLFGNPTSTRGGMVTPDLVCGLLGPTTDTLRELYIENMTIQHLQPQPRSKDRIDVHRSADFDQTVFRNGAPESEIASEWVVWTSNPTAHLTSIKKIRLKSCYIRCAWPDHSELLRHLPKVESFVMDDCQWTMGPDSGDGGRTSRWLAERQAQAVGQAEIELSELMLYNISGLARNLALNGVHAPHLVHLDLYRANLRGSSIVPHILSPGLENALPNLLSLDIGRSAISLADMMDILPRLPQLRFLNVSYCSLDNAFLEALERRDDSEKMFVPNLVALSIAGNNEISSGPLRRFIMSRTREGIPKASALALSAGAKGPVKKSGLFGPTLVRNSSPFAPSRPSQTCGQSQPKSTSPFASSGRAKDFMASTSSEDPATTPETPSSGEGTQAIADPQQSQKPVLPSIQWLNVDQCERIEPEAVDVIRKQGKVRFVSHAFGSGIDENRIRGKGRWKWDAEFEEGCGGEREGGCTLRRIPGSRDGWYTHHTCKKGVPKDPLDDSGDGSDRGWTWISSQSAGDSAGAKSNWIGQEQ
ncbi:hypothetical protein IAU59_004529 [Kwoniella sp. CBS 9459]